MAPGDLFEDIRQDLSSVVDVLEGRFLYLIKQGAQGVIPPEGVATELSLLSRDLKRCFRRLTEVEERRDLSFKVTKELQEISQRSIWLFRKIAVHRAFLRKLSLEAQLRGLVSPEVFDIYQRLLSLDEEERQSSASNDTEIRERMSEEDQNELLPRSTG